LVSELLEWGFEDLKKSLVASTKSSFFPLLQLLRAPFDKRNLIFSQIYQGIAKFMFSLLYFVYDKGGISARKINRPSLRF